MAKKNKAEKLLKVVDIFGQLEPEDQKRLKRLFKKYLKEAFDYGWCARARAHRELGALYRDGKYVERFELGFIHYFTK